jgi:hypothetical protein
MSDRDKIRIAALFGERHEVECLLAEALGYEYDEEFGWVIGAHTIVTLAMEVRDIMTRLPLSRDAVALAHHRYYSRKEDGRTCTEVDQSDYDYADILGEILAAQCDRRNRPAQARSQEGPPISAWSPAPWKLS